MRGPRQLCEEIEAFIQELDEQAKDGGKRNISLVPLKGIDALLAAWRTLPDAIRAGWTLLFVGSGPLADRVRAAAASDPEAIAQVPAVAPEALPRYYAAARLLVFPTLADTWGLVVNEAMASGLPVMCSTRAGCAEEMLVPGENGWLFDPADAAGFSETLLDALAEPAPERLGARAIATAERFTPERMAEGMRRAVRFAAPSS